MSESKLEKLIKEAYEIRNINLENESATYYDDVFDDLSTYILNRLKNPLLKNINAKIISDHMDEILPLIVKSNSDILTQYIDVFIKNPNFKEKFLIGLKNYPYKNELFEILYFAWVKLSNDEETYNKLVDSDVFEILANADLNYISYNEILNRANEENQAKFLEILANNHVNIPFFNIDYKGNNKRIILDNIDFYMNSVKDLYSLLRFTREDPQVYEKVKSFVDSNEDKAIDSIFCETEHMVRITDPVIKDVVRMIVSEVIKNENVKLSDITYDGGGFSRVIIAGNKVIKLGNRVSKSFPNNPYIIAPLLRKELTNGKTRCFIEVTERVDTREVPSKDDVYQLYKGLRELGLVWTDIKPDNVGKLIKDNVISWNRELKPSNEALSFDSKRGNKLLKAGDWIILDADFIYDEYDENINKTNNNALREEFEARYQEEKKANANNLDSQLEKSIENSIVSIDNDRYFLGVNSPILGGYLSSEQIDLLSIIQCNTVDELVRFISKCDQINHVDSIFESINGLDIESAKRKVFLAYQNTMVYHDDGLEASRAKRLQYLGITPDEMMSVIEKTHPHSQELLTLNHHFISEEWNQTKSITYEEMQTLGNQLSSFNSLTLGSGKIYNVVDRFDKDENTKYDFYFIKRDLDFAYKNNKQVRYHSLLVKDHGKIFDGKSKDEILEIINNYVKKSIDFIDDYNSNHKVNIDGVDKPVINAVDLFNEIISFDKNENGEYYNIWEQKYGISMPELMSCFNYALTNKPEGVNYLYNEPSLEDDSRRIKVIETLKQMTPGLIDTLGSQMHITVSQDLDEIKNCFKDFKKLQEEGTDIQITEFDMSLGKNYIYRVFGKEPDVSSEQVYQEKSKKLNEISKIINESGVNLSGVSYWSLTDGVDFNLERIRSDALKENIIRDVKEIPSAFGGLIPTYKCLNRVNPLVQEQCINQSSENSQKTI